MKREVREHDNKRNKREPCPSHQSGVSDVSRPLRLDSGDGSNGRDEDREAKPADPSHRCSFEPEELMKGPT